MGELRRAMAMEVRHPVLATAIGGMLLGVALRAVMPVTPLPPPEPGWRKSGAAMVEPVFSAQTYPVQANAWGHSYVASSAPGFVPHPYEETLAYAEKVVRTRYDELPRYEEPARNDAVVIAQEPIDDEGSTETKYVELPEPDNQPAEAD
jgi:hypothetical protein